MIQAQLVSSPKRKKAFVATPSTWYIWPMEHTMKPPRHKHLGKKARHMRELLNFTQEEVAEKMGVSQQTVSNIESSETVGWRIVGKAGKSIRASAEAIKDLNAEATVYNIVTNNSNNEFVRGQNIHCTF